MIIPAILHNIWLGGPMPDEFRGYRERFIAMHPGWRHILWTEGNVSALGINIDAIRSEYPYPAGLSNYIRLKAVLDMGGVFVDSDVEPIKPLDPLLHYTAFGARQDTDRICNAVFGAEPGHPWIRWQVERCHYYRGVPPYWGVEVMSVAPRDRVTVVPTEWFYPFLWTDPPEKRAAHLDSFVVHKWSGSWGHK